MQQKTSIVLKVKSYVQKHTLVIPIINLSFFYLSWFFYNFFTDRHWPYRTPNYVRFHVYFTSEKYTFSDAVDYCISKNAVLAYPAVSFTKLFLISSYNSKHIFYIQSHTGLLSFMFILPFIIFYLFIYYINIDTLGWDVPSPY